MEREISAADFFVMLEALLRERRAALKRRCRVAFAVVDEGPFLLDTAAPSMITREWRTDCDVSVICNRRTLDDMVRGRFDMKQPAPEHLFVWGGDRDVWRTLEKAFRGQQSLFAMQLDSKRERDHG